MSRQLFVTGRLAAKPLEDCLAAVQGLEYDVAILPISVAALMDVQFIGKHLDSPRGCDKVILPGLCEGDLSVLEQSLGVEVARGPKNLKDLPGFLGSTDKLHGYGEYNFKILAEIVDAHRMSLEEVLSRAAYYKSCGADIIDLGCPVSGVFPDIEKVIRALKQEGYRVSVDSFNADDILNADRAGVDFVLSVNSRNMEIARRLHCTVVVIPDEDNGLESLDRNIAHLEAWHIPYIIDPILNPIGFGISDSISNFIEVRRKYPKSDMLMGVGNVTELTDADSTGINALLSGIATELGINYVLTTEVAHWTHGCVRELDHARRLMHYAQRNGIVPKHLDDKLLTIKDPNFDVFSETELRSMQQSIKDHHFRIFTDRNFIYVFNNKIFIKGTECNAIWSELKGLDASHAFYIGKEIQKASIAIKLRKRYVQEEELRWGYLSE
jgi:dihydropteroate synthase-like protein